MRPINEILPLGQEKFSPKEAAVYLERKVDSSTITRWCQSGKIESEKPIGRWQITRSALTKLLVAFGVASHFMTTGLHHSKMYPPARHIYTELLHKTAVQTGEDQT